jgi:hypothetical protein
LYDGAHQVTTWLRAGQRDVEQPEILTGLLLAIAREALWSSGTVATTDVQYALSATHRCRLVQPEDATLIGAIGMPIPRLR